MPNCSENPSMVVGRKNLADDSASHVLGSGGGVALTHERERTPRCSSESCNSLMTPCLVGSSRPAA